MPLNKVMVEMATKGHLVLFDTGILFVTIGGVRSRLNTYVCKIYGAKTNTLKYCTINRYSL